MSPFEQRMEKYYKWMEQRNINGSLISQPKNIYYLTNFYSNPHERFMGLFLIKGQEPILIVPELDLLEAKKASTIEHIIGYSDSEGPDKAIIANLPSFSESVFGVEESAISYRRMKWLKGLISIREIEDIESGLIELRLIKDSNEIHLLKEAARWADKAIEYGIAAISIGKSELEIIAELEFKLKKEGIEKMSFETMVLTGENSASPHGKPGKEKIQKDSFVLFDLGVIVNGYCSDISRTVIVGKANEKQKEIYHIVKEAQQAAIHAVKADIPIKEIDLAARNVIENAGFGKYFNHRTGHGLGLDVHEYPSIHHLNHDTLKKGMVFTIEPGIYLPNLGGVRIEDDVLVTQEGTEVLTTFTKELIELP